MVPSFEECGRWMKEIESERSFIALSGESSNMECLRFYLGPIPLNIYTL